jgi:hypothetical protein
VARGFGVAPYALAFDGQALVTTEFGTLLRIDRATGATLSSTPVPVAGWITALAPVR